MVRQVPWLERKFSFDFPAGLFPVIYSRLEGSVIRLQHLVKNADDAAASVTKDGWSVKQHIGHLYDMEELWWKRLEDFQQGKQVLTAADMKNEKTTNADHNEKTIPQLLEMFAEERHKILEHIYWFNHGMLERTSMHPRLNLPMRVIDSLYFVAEHDDHHIAVIQGMVKEE